VKARWQRWWFVPIVILVLVGFGRLRIDVDVLNLLPPDLGPVQGLKLYQRHFANARELIITVRAAEPVDAERFAGALAAALRRETNLVTGAVWQPPWMEHPEDAGEIAAWLWFNQPPEVFDALASRLAPDRLPALLAEARETLATSMSPMDVARRAFDPYDLLNLPGLDSIQGASADQGGRMFASPDGKLRIIFVQARPALEGYRACADWLAAVRATAEEVRRADPAGAGLVVRFTGRPAFVAEIAAGMQRDLSGSITGTAVIIALLFWLVHRRWLPMAWLLTLLALILVATLGLGGLIFGAVNVISLGFAAVLLGLAVDYAVVHYQEALAHPALSVPEIRRAIAPSILWAAITTISAFLVLNAGGLPGLAQLGSLVAVGVALAALVMVIAFLPPLFRHRLQPPEGLPAARWRDFLIPPAPARTTLAPAPRGRGDRVAWITTACLVLGAGLVVSVKRPGLDRTAAALKPAPTEAEAALDELTAQAGIPRDPLWVVFSGADEARVQTGLARAEGELRQAVSNEWISGFLLPTVLWPHPEWQAANRPAARRIGGLDAMLAGAAAQAGFATNALVLTHRMLGTWSEAGAASSVVWPRNELSRWLIDRFAARGPEGWLALGLVYPATNSVVPASLDLLAGRLVPCGARLSGWEMLGAATLQRVRARFWFLVLPMVALVLLSLWLAFRQWAGVLLGLLVLGLGGLCLLALMSLAGWSWNLLNLMGVPLILGTGVDYTIFIQLALRRHNGDAVAVHRSVGRALLLCGTTAVVGFGSLIWSGSPGMAGLGRVCAVGIAANMLISIYLLPAWWARLGARRAAAPSALYSAAWWRLALTLSRCLPGGLLRSACRLAGAIYCAVEPGRRAIVVENLLPVLANDRQPAARAARSLYRHFAVKLLSLWQFENGREIEAMFPDRGGLEMIARLRQGGRGVLVLGPHLGNWEIGAPMLVKHGIPLTVITQAEPGRGLTELRAASRARWGVETLVIGTDSFAFVEVIKRLQDGAVVALLVDRPPPAGGVMVEFFGRPFRASPAAAELARASGCALVGVTVVDVPGGCEVRMLPEFTYDRRALGDRAARQELTGRILRAFEPRIREHPEQWYHFVPLWPASSPEVPPEGAGGNES